MANRKVDTSEIGSTGLSIWYGLVEERYISDLYGSDGIAVFDEMRRRDPTLKALLYVNKIMARTSTWQAIAASDKPADEEAADFLDSCLADMSHTVTDAVDDILSMLWAGWAWQEICYKRRDGAGGEHKSLFSDGKVGWRKWAPRKQTSWYKWEIDETGGLAGMWQWPLGGRMAPKAVLIPIEKSLHYVTEPDGGNPEGISLFEPPYEHWYFLKNLLPIMGIGFERGFGLPVFSFEEKPSDSDKAAVATLGKGLRMGEKAYVALPPGVKMTLETVQSLTGGAILDVIKYFRLLMLQSALAEFVAIGTGGAQSLAAHQDKSDLFIMAINGWLDKIEAVINRFAVPRLFECNEFPGLTALPTIQHSPVMKPKLGELGQFVSAIAGHIPGGLVEEDGVWIRHRAGMPAVEAEPDEEKPTPETGKGDEETGDEELSGPQITLADLSQAQADLDALREVLSAEPR